MPTCRWPRAGLPTPSAISVPPWRAGVELGIPAAEAKQAVMATLEGAVALLRTHGSHPEAEVDRVTTPGGLTIRGLNAMEAHGFTAAVVAGLRSSLPR